MAVHPVGNWGSSYLSHHPPCFWLSQTPLHHDVFEQHQNLASDHDHGGFLRCRAYITAFLVGIPTHAQEPSCDVFCSVQTRDADCGSAHSAAALPGERAILRAGLSYCVPSLGGRVSALGASIPIAATLRRTLTPSHCGEGPNAEAHQHHPRSGHLRPSQSRHRNGPDRPPPGSAALARRCTRGTHCRHAPSAPLPQPQHLPRTPRPSPRPAAPADASPTSGCGPLSMRAAPGPVRAHANRTTRLLHEALESLVPVSHRCRQPLAAAANAVPDSWGCRNRIGTGRRREPEENVGFENAEWDTDSDTEQGTIRESPQSASQTNV